MSAIRVVIADDSALARDVLRHILSRDSDILIVGEAVNGREAIALARQLTPALITMDLTMPVMDGLDAIEEIMHTKGVPILVVSDCSDAKAAYRALEMGALEVIGKPALDDEHALHLIERVKLLAGVSVITRLRRRALAEPAFCTGTPSVHAYPHIVAIACSTGGPQALARLLSRLPADFAAPVVIAQHISHGFIESMAQWLSTLCSLPVSVARHGESVEPGHIYLSPSESDLTITCAHRFRLVSSPPEAIYHPDCDTLLTSVANIYGTGALGIILTGMGRDGVQGMQAIHRAGGVTLAQDEASSVIYGMNQEAINAGVIQQVMSLEALSEQLIQRTHAATLSGPAPP